MATITLSNKWRNSIEIKDQFTDETTPEIIIRICQSLINQLEYFNKKEALATDLGDDEKYNIDNMLTEMIDHFSFVQNLADGTIAENTWHNYDFDGDFDELFNDYLSQLYDYADERIITVNNVSQKFLWIG